jgi:hypothetical protein
MSPDNRMNNIPSVLTDIILNSDQAVKPDLNPDQALLYLIQLLS